MKSQLILIFLFYSTFQVDCIRSRRFTWQKGIGILKNLNSEMQKTWTSLDDFLETKTHIRNPMNSSQLLLSGEDSKSRMLLSAEDKIQVLIDGKTMCEKMLSCIEKTKEDLRTTIEQDFLSLKTCVEESTLEKKNASENLSNRVDKFHAILQETGYRLGIELDYLGVDRCYPSEILKNMECLEITITQYWLSISRFEEIAETYKRLALEIERKDEEKINSCMRSYNTSLEEITEFEDRAHKCTLTSCRNAFSHLRRTLPIWIST